MAVGDRPEKGPRRSRVGRTVASVAWIALALALGWGLSYAQGGAGVVPPHWFYLPILLGAVRFGYLGTALTALAAGLLAGPLLPLFSDTGQAQRLSDWGGRAGFFLAIGLLLAFIVERRRRAESRHAEMAGRLAGLHEIDRAILGAGSPEEIGRAALSRLRRQLGCERATLVLFDAERGRAQLVGVDSEPGLGAAEGTELPLSDFPLPDVFLEAPALRIDDVDRMDQPELDTPIRDVVRAQGLRSFLAAPLVLAGQVVGALSVSSVRPGAFRDEHEGMVREVADQLAIALRQATLADDLRARAAELEARLAELNRSHEERRFLLSRLVNAQEDERRRVAGDIHDDSVQIMVAVGMRLSILRRTLIDPLQLAELAKVEADVSGATERLRSLMFELRPPALDREGLVPALRVYADRVARGAGFVVEIDNALETEPDPETRVIAYRIAQEALTNVRKHARAARVTVTLRAHEDGIFVEIRDDGVGIAFQEIAGSPVGHLGLTSMRERAEIAGGWCRVRGHPEGGTAVEFWVPAALPATEPVPADR